MSILRNQAHEDGRSRPPILIRRRTVNRFPGFASFFQRDTYGPDVKIYQGGFAFAFAVRSSISEAVKTPPDPVRIAMWSGPRNISTAMMRSWAHRADTAVVDEPFYASYLKATSKKHPGSPEIMAQCVTDVQRVIHNLIGPVPGGRRVYYQKQMTHHLLPDIDRGWLSQ